MGKAVLLSIHPEWCEKIASGQKNIEVRKTRPSGGTLMNKNLYRGKRKDNGEWVFGVPVENYGNTYILSGDMNFVTAIYNQPSVNDFCIRAYEVEPESVGLYCVPDINKIEIFKGDIVRLVDYDIDDALFIVDFGVCGGVKNVDRTVGYLGFHLSPCNERARELREYGVRDDIMFFIDKMQVVGNIIDNPEMVDGACL